MSNPQRYWRVEWTEHFRDKEQDRNFRVAARAARQCAAVLACPDAIATLKGVWVTSGWLKDRLGWTELDPAELIAAHDTATVESDLDDDALSVSEWADRIRDAWQTYEASVS